MNRKAEMENCDFWPVVEKYRDGRNCSRIKRLQPLAGMC